MGKPYIYNGEKKLTPSQLLDIAKAQAEDIITAAKAKARQEARIIHELAYDQGLALAERTYASKEQEAEDRRLARAAVLKRVGQQRLRAASFEVGGAIPINTKPAHRLENIEYLLSAGCPVEDALKRSGYNDLQTFKRAAYRHRRQDLIQYAMERIAS